MGPIGGDDDFVGDWYVIRYRLDPAAVNLFSNDKIDIAKNTLLPKRVILRISFLSVYNLE